MTYHTIINQLITLINKNPGWIERFNNAIISIKQYNLDEYKNIYTLEDWLDWCNDFLKWVPYENHNGNIIDDKLLTFHFFMNQPSLLEKSKLLNTWMINYAKEVGSFLDTTNSLTPESLASFYKSPAYHLDEYKEDPSGWHTFNQFFARQVKPGYRPIDGICDDSIIVSTADSVFKGYWPITSESTVIVKNIEWSIEELLNYIELADYFHDGTFMHAYLSPTDYHRLHVPMSGKVLHSEVVPGNVYSEVIVQNKKLIKQRLKSVDNVGFQFSQARGILLLETSYGIIGVLPIGMSLVSSVIMTAEPGVFLHKGEEFAYFQFGGSDYIMLFPASMNVHFNAKKYRHYNQGKKIAYIRPIEK